MNKRFMYMQKRFYPFANNVKHGLFTEILENTRKTTAPSISCDPFVK